LREKAEIITSMLREAGLTPDLVQAIEIATRRTPKGGSAR
jgi:hypothetical protein